jgi:hypothetical protein
VAIKEVMSVPDSAILDVAKSHGYEENEAFDADAWIRTAKDLGLRLKTAEYKVIEGNSTNKKPKRMTLAKVRDTYPTGTYLVRLYDHVLVLREGQIVDTNFDITDYHAPRKARKIRMNSKVYGLWKVLNPGGY